MTRLPLFQRRCARHASSTEGIIPCTTQFLYAKNQMTEPSWSPAQSWEKLSLITSVYTPHYHQKRARYSIILSLPWPPGGPFQSLAHYISMSYVALRFLLHSISVGLFVCLFSHSILYHGVSIVGICVFAVERLLIYFFCCKFIHPSTHPAKRSFLAVSDSYHLVTKFTRVPNSPPDAVEL